MQKPTTPSNADAAQGPRFWHTFGMRRSALLPGLALVLSACAGWGRGLAQDQPQAQEPVHTLRVFANLIQIATLVLDSRGQPVEEATHPKFVVRIDNGKPFAPAHVRLEGEDPLSLTVLLDASGLDSDLLHEMPFSLPSLLPSGLQPRDHVSLYALDCKLVRTLDDVPADKSTLKAGIEQALRAPGLHGGKSTGACAKTLPLLDTLALLTQQLGRLPGRRVILLVSHGFDRGSTHGWPFLGEFAKQNGVSLFGISTLTPHAVSRVSVGLNPAPEYDVMFEAVCRTTGGLVVSATERTLAGRLADFSRMLRGRYIVQFPRPDNMSAGNHLLTIEVAGHHYLIVTAGALVPVEDPHLKDDPTVVHGLGTPVDPGAAH